MKQGGIQDPERLAALQKTGCLIHRLMLALSILRKLGRACSMCRLQWFHLWMLIGTS
jgi:hypothetical protein